MGVLEKFGVEMIGAQAQVIDKAEDRDLFRTAMHKYRPRHTTFGLCQHIRPESVSLRVNDNSNSKKSANQAATPKRRIEKHLKSSGRRVKACAVKSCA